MFDFIKKTNAMAFVFRGEAKTSSLAMLSRKRVHKLD